MKQVQIKKWSHLCAVDFNCVCLGNMQGPCLSISESFFAVETGDLQWKALTVCRCKAFKRKKIRLKQRHVLAVEDKAFYGAYKKIFKQFENLKALINFHLTSYVSHSHTKQERAKPHECKARWEQAIAMSMANHTQHSHHQVKTWQRASSHSVFSLGFLSNL